MIVQSITIDYIKMVPNKARGMHEMSWEHKSIDKDINFNKKNDNSSRNSFSTLKG